MTKLREVFGSFGDGKIKLADSTVVNIEDMLREVSAEEPCGANLEYDPAFLELEKEIQGRPEVQYGDSITPAVPPEWKLVKKTALELLDRSRDLRVIGSLLRASLALHGAVGFAEVLLLIERLISERWDSVHPQLDPDDDMDPMLRINSLAILNEFNTTIKELKETTLVVLPGLGPLTLRGLEFSLGEVPTSEGVDKVSVSSITLAMRDLDPALFSKTLDALTQAYDSVIGIEKILMQRVGASQALSFDLLSKNLKRGRDFFVECNRQLYGVDSDSLGNEGVNSSAAVGLSGDGRTFAGKQQISGEILTREDVASMIDKICTYYQKYEPSSPVPLVLQRAKRLVKKNFFEIMEDLAPDGLHQVTMVAGASSSNDE